MTKRNQFVYNSKTSACSFVFLLISACLSGAEISNDISITSWREGRSWRPLQSVFSQEIKEGYKHFITGNLAISIQDDNADAARTFAIALINARSSDRNPAFGLILLSKLVDMGDARAMVELSRYYLDGVILRRDLLKAREFAVEALTKKGDIGVYSLLARIELAAGDRLTAIKRAEEGILNEEGESCAVLSGILGAGDPSLPDDKKLKVYELLVRGSHLLSLNSKRGLAKCLESGYGCEVNIDRASVVYLQLYEIGDPSAAMWLSSFHYDAWKRNRNDETARDRVMEYASSLHLNESDYISVAMKLRALVSDSIGDTNLAIYSELLSIKNQQDAKEFSSQVLDFISIDRTKSEKGNDILKDFFLENKPQERQKKFAK